MFLTPSAREEYRRYRARRWNRMLTAGLLAALVVSVVLGIHSSAPAHPRTPAPAVCRTAPARPRHARGPRRRTHEPSRARKDER
jgi:hypothetical protein